MTKFPGHEPRSLSERMAELEFQRFLNCEPGRHQLIDEQGYVYLSQEYRGVGGGYRIRYALEVKTDVHGKPKRDADGNFWVKKLSRGRHVYVSVEPDKMPKKYLHENLTHILDGRLHLG